MYEGRWSAGSSVLLARQRLFDGWPKLSLQSAATSAQRSAKFSPTTSLNKSNIERTCVISTQSDLNRAANYWLMAVLRFPHKGNGFFSSPLSSCCSLSQLRNLLASPGYQSSLVLGKNRCARPLVTLPSSRLSVILELRAIVWFNNICYWSAQVRWFREGHQCEKSASEASLPRSLSPNHWIKINKTNPVTVKNAEIYHTPFYT